MLGRLRRTTRLDVGLAISFAGVGYLAWVLVAGVGRELVKYLDMTGTDGQAGVSFVIRAIQVFFLDAGIAVDIIGLAWLVASLILVVRSSRQLQSISWAWLCAICQTLAAMLGAIVIGWAGYAPKISTTEPAQTLWRQITGMSLPVVMSIAVVVWVSFLVWLLIERARIDRHGPTLHDGLRTNAFRG